VSDPVASAAFNSPRQHNGITGMKNLLICRHALYKAARQAHSERWSGKTRNGNWIDQL